jgi:hypothetical protein
MPSIIKTIGTVTVRVYGPDGIVINQHRNQVVNTGQHWIATRIVGGGKAVSHIEVGTGTSPVASTDTRLQSPLHRQALKATPTVANNTITFTAHLAEGQATGPITEYGLFDAATGGILVARMVEAVVTKSATMAMDIVWQMEFRHGSD